MAKESTLYDLLDLEHNATGAQILRRYRLMRDELSAESVPLDDPQMIALNDAYRVLSNADQRAEYDDSLREQGLYNAVERVDERTSLSDLFEIDEVETSPNDESQPEAPAETISLVLRPRPIPSVEHNPERAERVRQFKAQQRRALTQSVQRGKIERVRQRAPKNRTSMGCFVLVMGVCFGTMILVLLASKALYEMEFGTPSNNSNGSSPSMFVVGMPVLLFLFLIWLEIKRRALKSKRLNQEDEFSGVD